MTDIQNKLNQAAIIVRKYQLGNEDWFISKFYTVHISRLNTAWTLAERKIQNREIIKNASHLSVEEANMATLKADNYDNNSIKLYEKLISKFDVKELKLTDENVERKVRNILALMFINNVSNEINEFVKKNNNSLKNKALRFISKIKYWLIWAAVIGVFLVPRVIEGLTPPEKLLNEYLHDKYSSIKSSTINVDVLTNYLHEDSKYEFDGSICRDGTTSHSQGRGTCSWHGGVRYEFYKGEYSKSIDECRQDAIKKIRKLRKKAIENSWRD